MEHLIAFNNINEADDFAKSLHLARGKGTCNGAPYWRDADGRIYTAERIAELAGY